MIVLCSQQTTEDPDANNIESVEWANLPFVPLVGIFKHLRNGTDRLNASSVCKNWRQAAFIEPFSQTLSLVSNDALKISFLASHFARKVQSVVLQLDSGNVDEIVRSLEYLKYNANLNSIQLGLCPRSLLFWQKSNVLKVLNPLMGVLKAKNQLKYINVSMLTTEMGEAILETLVRFPSRHSIEKLRLTQNFPITHVEEKQNLSPTVHFTNILHKTAVFNRLEVLSIGYEFLDNAVLKSLGSASLVGGIKELVLVARRQNHKVSFLGWSGFVANNPKAEVRLTVLGNRDVLSLSSNILFSNIPITHFRVLNFKQFGLQFLEQVISWNYETLEHLEIVRGSCLKMMEMASYDQVGIDPVVFAAWRCQKLHTIKLRLTYCGENLVGVARLMGERLRILEIPKCHIQCRNLNLKRIVKEVSSALKRPWTPSVAFKNVEDFECVHGKKQQSGVDPILDCQLVEQF